ncbi:hypothetical protein HDEF_1033 [Candidatus Hamiltonella defensa 5AT (Acyrthosiphon pisum)]|uniref:Uncharacterized protein n=1 Tax=Hamiltonella defensa subsp. Acyrthosiphon pisum (strain 5AT) TaxID=572265 RepID=C4K584_HAMD5|nr:hypothetical protein HDEF_1033 [Candidatus Hamiltonella defensa 5AT (Acyrthosiphon pisum)]
MTSHEILKRLIICKKLQVKNGYFLKNRELS